MKDYKTALKHRQKGEYDKAIQIYREQIKKSATYDIIREYAHTLCEAQEYEKAIPQYELALSLYPQPSETDKQSDRIDYFNTCIGLARANSALRNFEEAHAQLNRIKDENYGRIQIEKAIIYIEQRNNTEDTQQKKKLNDTAQQLLLQIGQNPANNQKTRQEAYFKLGYIAQNPKEALDYYKKSDQNSHQVLFNIANCYLKLQDYQNAGQFYCEAFETNQDPNYKFNLAKTFELSQAYEEAIEEYQEALLLENISDSCKSKCYFSIGNCLLHQKKYQESIEKFDEAIKIDADNALIYFNKGMSFYQQNKFEEAQKSYQDCLSRNPGLKSALFQLGNILIDKQQFKEALQKFNVCIEVENNEENNQYNALVYSCIGFCYYQLQKLPESEENFEKAVSLDQKNHYILCNYGILKIKMNKPEQALKQFQQALKALNNYYILTPQQKANNMQGINALINIAKIQLKLPSILNSQNVKGMMSDIEEGDIFEKLLSIIDLSRENQTTKEQKNQEMENVLQRIQQMENKILLLNEYNQKINAQLENQDKKLKQIEYFQKKKEEEINEMAEIINEELLHDYYNAILEEFNKILQIAYVSKKKDIYDIQIKVTAKAQVASFLLSYVPYCGNILSEGTLQVDQLRSQKILDQKASLIFDIFPNSKLFDQWCMYVARKVTLSKKDLVKEYLKQDPDKGTDPNSLKEKAKKFFSWIGDKVKSVTKQALTFVTQVNEFEDQPIKQFGRSEALASFQWYFNFVEKNAFKEEFVVRKTDVLAEMFIDVLTCDKQNPDYQEVREKAEKKAQIQREMEEKEYNSIK